MSIYKALNEGDTLAIIAPANWADEDRLQKGVEEIKRGGFTPFVHPQCHLREGRFCGSDDARLEALYDVYSNADVKAIICLRGGYGSQRFIDRLDLDLIARHPKPLIGYSDITVLLNAISQRTGQITIHGPMLVDAYNYPTRASWDYLWAMLRGKAVQPQDHPAAHQAKTLVEGKGSGLLWGGNLSLLAADCGTEFQLQPRGGVLLIEEVGEDLYRFDRMLWQLKRSGVLDSLSGVIVGDLEEVADIGPPAFGTDAWGVVKAHFGHLGIPVATHYPAGHSAERIALPIGGRVTLETSAERVSLTHMPLFAP